MSKYTASVKGGLHANYSSSLAGIGAWTNIANYRYSAQTFAHRRNFEARALLNALIGAAPGATASANYYEIEPNVEMGGRRNIITTSLINRATTSADVTDFEGEVGALSANTYVASPVFNGDRNPLGTR